MYAPLPPLRVAISILFTQAGFTTLHYPSPTLPKLTSTKLTNIKNGLSFQTDFCLLPSLSHQSARLGLAGCITPPPSSFQPLMLSST